MFSKALRKIIIGLIALVVLIVIIIWLWQRQPTTQKEVASSQKTERFQQSQDEKLKDQVPNLQSNLVVNNAKIRLEGKTDPNNYLIFTSEFFSQIIQADSSGAFDEEISLNNGLNLIDFASVSPDLKEIKKQQLIYYFDSSQPSKTVYAGTVKSVFDNLITLTIPEGTINIRTSRSTNLNMPDQENSNEATNVLKNIRIGDFAISLGDTLNQETQTSNRLTIIRDDKPQNPSQMTIGIITTSPKQNLFTAKNLNDSKNIELTLSKNSQIKNENESPSPSSKTPTKTSPQPQITKDKKAIIIFHQEDNKNFVDFIYLLP